MPDTCLAYDVRECEGRDWMLTFQRGSEAWELSVENPNRYPPRAWQHNGTPFALLPREWDVIFQAIENER